MIGHVAGIPVEESLLQLVAVSGGIVALAARLRARRGTAKRS